MKIHDNGTDREMNETELAEYELRSQAELAEREASETAQAERDAARASALAKLAALGLTDAEIAALLGA
jgi:hypothetical protein